MNKIIRNIFAIILGWLGGSIVNMSLVRIGNNVLPIEGLDPSDMEAFAALIPTLDPQFFIFPFFAHALGTLIGALIAGLIAFDNKMKFSIGIGFLFLLGGIAINYMLPGAMWFSVLDILFAYIPMAWIGGLLAFKWTKKK